MEGVYFFKAFIPASSDNENDISPVFQNKPQLRAKLIRNKFEQNLLSFEETQMPESDDLFLTLTQMGIASGEYLNFLRYAYLSAKTHNNPDWFTKDSLIPFHFIRQKPPASIIRQIPIYKLSGFYGNDTMSPIGASTWQEVMKSAYNTYQAMNALRDGKLSMAYAINTSPGHHATFDVYGGYCFLNNAAFAARCLQHHEAKTSRVAILDLDYHAGDGTQDLLKYDGILTISLHADASAEYPDFTGFVEENTATNFNYPLPGGTTWTGANGGYSKALTNALEKIRNHRTEYLIIAFGADTYKGDPDPHPDSRFALELEDYHKMGTFIRKELKDLNPKILVTQEGGYNLEAVPTIVSNFWLGLAGMADGAAEVDKV